MTFEELKNQPLQLLPLSGNAVEDHEKIPSWHKFCLNIHEASEYFGIAERNMYEIARQHGDEFVIRIGKKILIERAAFEGFLKEHRHL